MPSTFYLYEFLILVQEEFKGQVLHSTSHHSAKDHLGKKVVVVGACTSGMFPLLLVVTDPL